MIEVKTLSFILTLHENKKKNSNCAGSYYLMLFCESPFDVSKSFSEEFLVNSALAPFYDLHDVSAFAEEMAGFWKMQTIINPRLDITRLEELADLWQKLTLEIKDTSHRDLS